MKLFNVTHDGSIEKTRIQLLYAILYILSAMGLPTIIIAGLEAYLLQQYSIILVYMVFFIPIMLVTIFRKRLSYKLIASIVISSTLLMATSDIVFYGIGGAGIPIFFSVFVFTTTFFDLKSGIYVVILSSFITSVIGYLYTSHKIVLRVSLDEISTNPISWITALAVLVFLGLLIVLSYGLIHSKMIQSIKLAKQKTDELMETNIQLSDDVQKHKLTELQLQKSEALLLEAHRIAKIGNWEYNLLSGELKMAKICYSIMELNNDIPANQLNDYITNRIHPDDLGEYERVVLTAIEKVEAYSYKHKALFDNDRIKFILTSGEPIKDSAGKLIGYAGIIQDISKLKQSEEKIQKLNEELEQKVISRTAELEQKYIELEKINMLFVGRELRMAELKTRINILENEKNI